jgi:hypothetical protein
MQTAECTCKWRCQTADGRIQHQIKSDALDHRNIKETNPASAVCSFENLAVSFGHVPMSNETGLFIFFKTKKTYIGLCLVAFSYTKIRR